MIDITEDLKRYKELEQVWDKYLWRDVVSLDPNASLEGYPLPDDPRLGQFLRLAERLKDIALKSDAVVITERTLYQLFHQIRSEAIYEAVDEKGTVFRDDFFYHLAFKYHPNEIALNLSATKPLVTVTEIPQEVEDLITETRETYCLGLPTACISLCRSTVERAIVDIAVRCGRVEDNDRLGEMGMCDRISLLIDRTVSYGSTLRKDINAFMAATSNVIHSNTEADMTSALKLYHDSLSLIQALYAQYSKQFKK